MRIGGYIGEKVAASADGWVDRQVDKQVDC